MVSAALVLGSRLVVRLLPVPLGRLTTRSTREVPRMVHPHRQASAPSALVVPDDEEPTWEDAEWQ